MSHPTNHERPDPAYATRASAGQLPRGGGAVSVDDSVMGGATERVNYGRSGIYGFTVRRDGQPVAEFRGCSHIIGRAPA